MAEYNDKTMGDKETVEPQHGYGSETVDEETGVVHTNKLNRDLKSRHMQMIAIGTVQILLETFLTS